MGAAHLMSPFAGEDVNLAMADVMGWAHALVEGVKNGDGHGPVRRFEEKLFEHAGPIQRLSQAAARRHVLQCWRSQITDRWLAAQSARPTAFRQVVVGFGMSSVHY